MGSCGQRASLLLSGHVSEVTKEDTIFCCPIPGTGNMTPMRTMGVDAGEVSL